MIVSHYTCPTCNYLVRVLGPYPLTCDGCRAIICPHCKIGEYCPACFQTLEAEDKKILSQATTKKFLLKAMSIVWGFLWIEIPILILIGANLFPTNPLINLLGDFYFNKILFSWAGFFGGIFILILGGLGFHYLRNRNKKNDEIIRGAINDRIYRIRYNIPRHVSTNIEERDEYHKSRNLAEKCVRSGEFSNAIYYYEKTIEIAKQRKLQSAIVQLENYITQLKTNPQELQEDFQSRKI